MTMIETLARFAGPVTYVWGMLEYPRVQAYYAEGSFGMCICSYKHGRGRVLHFYGSSNGQGNGDGANIYRSRS